MSEKEIHDLPRPEPGENPEQATATEEATNKREVEGPESEGPEAQATEHDPDALPPSWPARQPYYLAAGLQVLVLVLLTLSGVLHHRTGTTVRLRTQPVDPRDLFRGDFVILRYEINRLDLSKLRAPEEVVSLSRGSPVWIQLEKGEDGVSHPVSVSSRFEPSSSPQIRGFLRDPLRSWSSRHIEVRYGIDAFFVEEGTGKDLERRAGRGALEVEVVLARTGQAHILRLH